MKSELRLTDTNAASDSKGRTWGLDGNLFWWVVGGIGAGIALFFLCIVVLKVGLLTSFGVAVVPVLLCLTYILGFRQGKPPGYDRDRLDYALAGTGFAPETHFHSKHPLSENWLGDRTIVDRLDAAEAALRENLHRHDLDPTARAHLERAASHTREAYVAMTELGKARTVGRLVNDLEKAQNLVDRLREKQSEQIISKPHRHHV